MTDDFIFVYGTLRKETATPMHCVLARYCDYFSNGTMQGKLYEVDGYPGAIESNQSGDRVHGEVYRIINREMVFIQLDEYEECSDTFPQPHEYIRKKGLISLPDGGNILAWVYIFNHDLSTLTEIKSGDYLGYIKCRGAL
ncbi:gamma-glutamylcyclotransferase [Vibrio albus]|uniref:Gamma-glutamylcyclotransferase n=1 Tax=Vibrio albus TaxID=2200953 RepID=A0A2U3B8S6_9VIBR|nr:gamma-glutamylcyclotransferase family protein [Vibrio albus]PWI33200.1 gamma-glutamylcyclotransferase [Vibrio albus]